jgi:prevent-host-death family protein
MKQVGIFDAKTHLSSLVDEVEQGREIVITRHGKPVAKLVRADKFDRLTPEQVAKRRQALKELRKIGERLKINATQEEIKSWIEEGRR